MAISASGIYVVTFLGGLGSGQIGLNLDADTHKVALFNNSLTTPNFTTDTAYGAAPYNANEVSGTGYTAGGVTLLTATLTGLAGVATFDAADVSWTSSTITAAKGALIYADALAGNQAIVLVNLGADYSTTAGTLAITWSASGIANFTLA